MMKTNRKWIYYSFSYKGKRYNKKQMDNFNILCDNIEYNSHLVPILIERDKPSLSFILFHPRDFVYFGYNIPDSMNWLFKCIEPKGSYILSPAPISPHFDN